MLDTCKLVSASDAKFKWASVEFLDQNKVAPWSDMPVWVPDTAEDAGFSRVNISKAVNSGLKFLPLEETVRDTIKWAAERPEGYEWKAGLSAEREAELLRLMREE